MPPAAIKRHIGARTNGLQQHQRRHLFGVLKATALGALHHQAIDTRIDAFECRVDRGNRVVDGDARILQGCDELGRASRRGGHKLDSGCAHKFEHLVVTQKPDRQIDTKGQVSSADILVISALQISVSPGRCLDDAQAAGTGDGRRKLGARNPAHGGLEDGVFGAGVGKNAVHIFV